SFFLLKKNHKRPLHKPYRKKIEPQRAKFISYRAQPLIKSSSILRIICRILKNTNKPNGLLMNSLQNTFRAENTKDHISLEIQKFQQNRLIRIPIKIRDTPEDTCFRPEIEFFRNRLMRRLFILRIFHLNWLNSIPEFGTV